MKLEDIKPKLLETINSEKTKFHRLFNYILKFLISKNGKDKFFVENEKKDEKLIVLDLLT